MVPWICFSFVDSATRFEFSPHLVAGSGNPGPTCATWAKIVNGVTVASRTGLGSAQSQYDEFADGTGLYVNCNEQNET
jgi:hypothetical protein